MILVGSVALWAHVDCGVIETRPTLGAATSRQQGNTLPSTSGINHYNRGRSSSDHLLRQSSTADGLSAIPLALCKQVPGSGFYYRIMTRQFYFQNKSNDSVGSNRINDFSLSLAKEAIFLSLGFCTLAESLGLMNRVNPDDMV